MMIDLKRQIKNNFQDVVSDYVKHAKIQKIAANHLFNYLGNVKLPDGKIIDLGCGDMMHSLALADIFKRQVHAVDLIACNNEQENIIYHQHDFDNFKFDKQSCALVFSNMSIQWSFCLEKLFLNIASGLKRDGLFIFSLPISGTFDELHVSHRNQFYTIENVSEYLFKAGFRKMQYHQKKYILNFNNQLQALHSIKKTGAHTILKRHDESKKGLSSIGNIFITDKAQLSYVIATFCVAGIGWA